MKVFHLKNKKSKVQSTVYPVFNIFSYLFLMWNGIAWGELLEMNSSNQLLLAQVDTNLFTKFL